LNTDLPGPDAASGGQGPPLNYYGELVRRQWEGCLPEIYQEIRDPGNFFAQRIDEHIDDMAGDDPRDEGYLAKVGHCGSMLPRSRSVVNPCAR
jgi:hypothetical protein